MDPSFQLTILTPERQFFSGPVQSLTFTTSAGGMGVMAGHAPVIVALDPCAVRFKEGEAWKAAAVSSGFAEIDGRQATVFVSSAEWPHEIEEERAMNAQKRAEERIQSIPTSDVEYMRSKLALERARARLDVKGGPRGNLPGM